MPQTPALIATPTRPSAPELGARFSAAAVILQPAYPRSKKQPPDTLFLSVNLPKAPLSRPRHHCRFRTPKEPLTTSALCSISARTVSCQPNAPRLVDNLLITQIRHAQAPSPTAVKMAVKLGKISFVAAGVLLQEGVFCRKHPKIKGLRLSTKPSLLVVYISPVVGRK